MDQSRGLITGTLVLLLRAALCYNTDVLQDLRLAGGDGRCEGRVEVNIQGEWGTVCDDAWSDKNTEVVCRQLGCPQAPTHSVKASSFGAGIGKVWLTDVTCSGEETSLKECKYSIEEGDICDHRNDVGVICSGEAEMLRLVGGGSECEGRVEVKHRGEWGTVCGVNWRRQEAAVVCKQLGCNFTNIIQVRAASFGAGSGRIWLSHVKCAWDEPDLWACQHRMWGSGRCKHQDDAGVICSAAPVEPRLVGGDTECEGRLEVKHQGEWGTVCGESWQEKEAAVVCRHLGCSSSHGEAVLVQATSFGPGSGKIWLSDVTCAGQESDLWQCKHQMWGNPFCQHKQDVGVICAGEPEEIKLVDGQTECEGRLMVKHRGEWGSVCGYYWGVPEATVACRQLGCGSLQEDGVKAKTANFGAGSGKTWLSHVKCTGRESSLAKCHHRMWGVEGCRHKDDVGVVCEDKNTGLSSQFRLVNGSQRCSGRVERIYAGKWGAMCGEHWDLRAANVLCRQLHCGTAVSVPRGGYFGENHLVWKDEFHCKGTESDLKQCTKATLGNHNCPNWVTAGIICTGTAETLRLVDGPGHCEGRLEVLQKNIWGRVLDHQWDMKEAEVVCRQLHCREAIGSFRLKEPISGTVAWNSVTCQGSEKHIEDCSVTINSSSVASSNLVTDVGVICSAAEERSVHLVDSFHRCAGLVEVYRRGEWGMIRGDAWDLEDGDVICRELHCGCISKVEGQSISRTGKLWLTGLNCAGNETTLWQCPYSSWGTSASEEKEAARVACSDLQCKSIPGKLRQIDAGAGGVFGVNSNDDIYQWVDNNWKNIPGKLIHVSVGPAGIWGVNRANNIFKIQDNKWVSVSGLLKQVDAGGNKFLGGVNSQDNIYCLRQSCTVSESSAVSWTQLEGGLKYYSCGPLGCWGVNSADNIYFRYNVSPTACQGTKWQQIEGALEMIEVGTDGSVYGVNSAGNVYRRDGIGAKTPTGTSWTQLDFCATFKHVTYDNDYLWLITPTDDIMQCSVKA